MDTESLGTPVNAIAKKFNRTEIVELPPAKYKELRIKL